MVKRYLLFLGIALLFSLSLTNTNVYAYEINEKVEKKDTIKKPQTNLIKYAKFFIHLFKKKKINRPRVLKKRLPHLIATRFQNLKKFKNSSSFLEKDWDSIQDIKKLKYHSVNDTTHKRVFGFHPYWMGSAYKNYDFELLTDIAYFSFELDPKSGTLKKTESWKKTSLIDSARAYHCNLYFTISNFTNSNNTTFLENKKAQQKTEEEVLKILKKHELQGVVLDFEDVPKAQKSNLEAFIKQLSQSLEKEKKTVCITLPAINNGVYDVSLLEKYVAYFLLMGYDYFGSWSNTAGPIAPMNSENIWGSYSVEKSVNDYLKKGLSRNQLILTVPYYGGLWQTEDSSLPAKAKKFDSHLTYRQLKEKLPHVFSYDKLSKSAYYSYLKDGSHQQVWFEDSTSLAHKYDFINRENLAGVGIWALGYDNGYNELWSVLDKKFGSKDGTIPGDLKIPKKELTAPVDLAIKKNPFTGNYLLIKSILLAIVLAFLLAFLISLRRKRVRNFLLQHAYASLLVLLSVTIALCWWGFHFKYTNYLIIGLIGLVIGFAFQMLYKNTTFIKFFNHKMP